MEIDLKEWRISDAEILAEILSNEKVTANLRDLPNPYSVSDAEFFIREAISADKNDNFIFAVEADGRVVGCVGCYRQENIHRKTAEIGYYIAEEFWGKGIAARAVKSVADFVFGHTDIVRIYAEPFADNAASRRVLEKCGFAFEGTLKCRAEKFGVIKDTVMYSLLRPEYAGAEGR